MSCWPVAAGCAGVVREAARLESSAEVFACWSLRFSATGPVRRLSALVTQLSDKLRFIPLVTLWVMGWFLTVLAAAEASRKACQ